MASQQPEDVPPTKPSPRLQTLMSRTGRIIARTSIPEILLLATLCMARYIKNSDFSYPSEIILSIVLLGVIASGVFYMYRLILRRSLGAHVAALLLTYSLYGFDYTFATLRRLGDNLLPYGLTSFEYALLQTLFLGVLFGIAGYGVQRLFSRPKLDGLPVLKFVVFVVCFIFAVQLGKVGLRIVEIRQDLTYTQPQSSLGVPTSKPTSKPNVYYLLFDRYANATTLKDIYDYDNTPLLSNLKEQGFVVRDDAYANYPFTMHSLSSTLGVNYHTKVGQTFNDDAQDFQTGFAYRKIIDNSPVTQAFQANGYSYNQVSSWWDFTRDNPSADTNPSKSFRLRILGRNFWLTDLQRDIVNKSILSPLLLKGATFGDTTLVQYQLDRNPAQNFYAQMAALKNIAKNSSTQTKPQFTFAHILSPHDPYIFDAQGNSPKYNGDRTDWDIDETVKYTNQLTYLNTQIATLIADIRSKDPSAAIVIQADEGPYPKQFRGTLTAKSYYDPINLPLAQQKQKFSALAAYYMPGVDEQTAQSELNAHVNTFRFVLNNYLNYQLPKLPDCQFTVGDKFKLYDYQLISGKLKGTAEPIACNQYR